MSVGKSTTAPTTDVYKRQGFDFFQQLVVGNDLPVYFALVGADAALFHLAGGWPQMDRGNLINALPLVCLLYTSCKEAAARRLFLFCCQQRTHDIFAVRATLLGMICVNHFVLIIG